MNPAAPQHPARPAFAVVRRRPGLPPPANPGIEECREFLPDHEDLLESLIAFFTERGRLPTTGELPTAPQLTTVRLGRRKSVLPMHGKKDMPIGTMKAIKKNLGLK